MQINQIAAPMGAPVPSGQAPIASARQSGGQAAAGVTFASRPQVSTQPPAQAARAQEASSDIQAAIEEANREPSIVASNLSFSIDQDSRRVVVKLVDTTTKDVIRQIPSEDFLRISKALQQMQGVFVSEKA